MVQYIKQADTFGRVGSGIGQGLAQQLPEEITRGRMQHGLQQLEGQQGLTPFQQFSRLSAIPGVTPQMVQSGAELLRQEGISQGLKNVEGQQQPKPWDILEGNGAPSPTGQVPTVGQKPQAKGYTTAEQTAAAIKPYIAKNQQQLQTRAAELARENPQLYPTAKDALAGAVQEDQAFQNQSASQQAARQSAIGVENRVREGLKALKESAGAAIPDRINQEIENDVLDKIENGMDELQAIKEGQKEQDRISQRFSTIGSWGGLSLPLNDKQDLKQSIRAAQKDAKAGKYQKEAAEYMIANNNVTPQRAFSLFNPVRDYPELNNQIKSMPVLERPPIMPGLGIYKTSNEKADELTLKAAPKLAKAMGLEGSPLAVMQEIERKGYNGQVFKKYLIDNQSTLNLSSNQLNELQQTNPSFFGQLNDIYLNDFSGIE